ncbi:[Fe-Fe] hydrogenase large subunit C-terminal domain-containing protein [Mogibacterium sp.]|uniref:[Fe-Fe] hydrogenase large subunit C-terminal domain-containing protein n=1 Tax=Mogibacterium sp. TaxID=2049035 RepID=UPI00257B6C0C|nr:[Fe-Fe] hydrogenase large subunit C-terminal domain-containing protein [Mogibacterium sp.]MBN2935904.1 4Fe-4S binding protein [Mogibacterium sp.]MEE1374525.1 [Fe-Fe] hydrogenase large subunit C-terminal domain-containing protein [Clostridia bacterium]
MAHCLTLKKSNCKNCYKCIRNCPVKAIRFSGDQAHIIADECILCGRCFVVCPQNAKEIVSEVEKVKVMIQSGEPVIASMAPSFIANYDGVGIDAMREGLQKLGFADVEETAIGATMVKTDYERLVHEKQKPVIISSACASVNLLIQKHYPEMIKYLADTLSPMQAHCRDIKRRNPEAKTVFIGPCVAKKDEAQRYPGIVDAALTFEELTEWLEKENVRLEKKVDSNPESLARIFPTVAGILRTMKDRDPEYEYVAVDGIDNCIAALEDVAAGHVSNCFMEMSACKGSCVNGPVMEKYHPWFITDYLSVTRYAGDKDFPVEQPEISELSRRYDILEGMKDMPTERKIQEILSKMGKKKPSDELNCGTCGYDTCREKAIAIYQGKAEIEMCLPYLKEKAENFSNIIFDNTPNGLLVLNERLEIQQINPAACRIMNIRRPSDVLGSQIVTLLDPKPFLDALESRKSVFQCAYLAEYDRYVEEQVLYDQSYRMLFCMLEDVSDEAAEREKKAEMRRQTTEVADKVVEKQMRIVQDIASLLGETAAETKIALTNLKESMKDE